MTTPEPLPQTVVALVLEYIAGPAFPGPLPGHLVSTPLAQRHHFLHITPDQPAQYLAWPSDRQPDAQQTAVDLLQSLQTPLQHPVYTVRYTADAESSFAHVPIATPNPPGLRLVFQWSPDGWKFHNLALMPFPPNTNDSVHEIRDDPPDSYWDAYAHNDDQGDATEDAYWDQYSTVYGQSRSSSHMSHSSLPGSADSERPTPPTTVQKRENARVVVDYPYHRTSSPYNPLAPPSPGRLSRLLANVSPRPPSPPLDSDSGFDSASPSEEKTRSSLPSASHRPAVSSTVIADNDSRTALKNTVRGLYQLWRVNKVADSSASDKDREEFLEIVRQALDD
ncbi:hypothetical protein C0993_003712 [Termitomyces sp. T159_Od127]|nr:hypothetical protein C0993_003712 [Termitomyces sp. T159_Od127]